MPDGPLNVFVSSTWIDLKAERAAVLEVTHRLRGLHFLGMEFMGSRDGPPGEVSLDEVDRADVYVGILGGRYGSGVTELEYSRAKDRGLPCFIYFKSVPACDASPSGGGSESGRDLETFRRRLLERHTCSEFATPDDLALKLAADLHNWLFERRIGAGLARLSTDYVSRVQAFVTEYLGTPDRPVPFGGRGAELTALTGWLTDAAAPRRLLIAAGAGKGKSALLVRWVSELLTRPDVAPVFFPVSIRFRTNLASVVFPSLATCLAALHNEPLTTTPDTPPDVWRGVFTDFLARPLRDGRHLVIVLDGLDEAADWDAGPDLFPPHLSRHARVIVSARFLAGDVDAGDWLRRLGWETPKTAQTLTLSPLEQPAVAEVLDRMGFPLAALGDRTDIVAELHRLSRGEPLVVRLYVDDLWGRGDASTRLRVEDLSTIEPGLGGFFARWWDDQRRLWGSTRPLRETRVQTLMNFLACALGPLTRDDLFALAGPIVDLNTWTLEETLEPLRRFIVGDGLHSGFVYSHPGLAIHFRERLSSVERDTLDARIRDWCVESVQSVTRQERSPEQIPAYVLQYFGAHLDRANAPVAAFAPMLTDAWRRGWVAFEGTYAGYRADLKRAQLAASRHAGSAVPASGEQLAFEIRTALCMASVDQLLANTSPELIVALVEKGVWSRTAAIGYARMIGDRGLRAQALVDLGSVLPEPTKTQVFSEALEASAGIGISGQVRLLTAAAPRLPPALVDDALNRILSSHDAQLMEAVIALSSRLSADQVEKVVSIAPSKCDEDLRWRVLRALAAAHPEELCRRARTDAGLGPWERAHILVDACDGLPRERRSEVLGEAAAHARTVVEDRPRLDLLVSIAERLDPLERTGLVDDIVHQLGAVDYAETRVLALLKLCALVPADAAEDFVRLALADCERIGSEWARATAIASFAPRLGTHRTHAALDLLRTIGSDTLRASALAALVPYLSPEGRDEVVTDLLNIADPIERAGAAVLIADLVPETAVEAVAALAEGLLGPTSRFGILRTLAERAPAAVREDLLEEGLSGLDELAQCAALAGACGASLRARIDARIVNALSQRDFVPSFREEWLSDLLLLMRHWAASASEKSIAEAASAILNWTNNRARIAVINGLALHLPSAILESSVRVLQTIGDDADRRRLQAHCLALVPPSVARERHARVWTNLGGTHRVRLQLHWLKQGSLDSEALRAEIIRRIPEVETAEATVEAVSEFVALVGSSLRATEVSALFDATLSVDDARTRAIALAWLVPHLHDSELARFGEMLAAVLYNHDEVVQTIVRFASRVPASTVLSAFSTECDKLDARLVEDGWYRVRNKLVALARVAAQLDEPVRSAAGTRLISALAGEDPARELLLKDVSESIAGRFDTFFEGYLAVAQTIADPERRLPTMFRILPGLESGLLDQALRETIACLDEVRWDDSGDAGRHTPAGFPEYGDYGLADSLARAGAWRAAIVVHCLAGRSRTNLESWAEVARDDIRRAVRPVPIDVYPVLLPVASPSLRTELADEALERLRALPDSDVSKARVLIDLVDAVPASHLPQVVDVALTMTRSLATLPPDDVAVWPRLYDSVEKLLAALLPKLSPEVAVQVWSATAGTGLFSGTILATVFVHLPDRAMALAGPTLGSEIGAIVHRVDPESLRQWIARRLTAAPDTLVADIEATQSPEFISLSLAHLVPLLDGEARRRCQATAMQQAALTWNVREMLEAARGVEWPELERFAVETLTRLQHIAYEASQLLPLLTGAAQSQLARLAVSEMSRFLPDPGVAVRLEDTLSPSTVISALDVFLDGSDGWVEESECAVRALLPHVSASAQIALIRGIGDLPRWIRNPRASQALAAAAQNPDVALAFATCLQPYLLSQKHDRGDTSDVVERSLDVWWHAPAGSPAWQALWHRLIFGPSRSRSDLMRLLDHKVPALLQAAGPEAFDRIVQAVDDVAVWWP